MFVASLTLETAQPPSPENKRYSALFVARERVIASRRDLSSWLFPVGEKKRLTALGVNRV